MRRDNPSAVDIHAADPELIYIRDSFSEQMVSQGMPADYVATMNAVTPVWVLAVMVIATFLLAFVGGLIGKALLKKHFEKAGMV